MEAAMVRSRRAAAVKEEVSEPPVDSRRLWLNLTFLTIITLDAGLVWLTRGTGVAGLLTALTLLGPLWAIIAFLWGKILKWFDSESKKWEQKLKAILQSPRSTPWLAGLALLSAVPAAFALPWFVKGPPLLWILPGNGVYNYVTEAGKPEDLRDSAFRYVLQIKQDGRSLTENEEGEVVTGAGSIFVGKDPKRQLALFKQGLDPQRLEAKVPPGRSDVLQSWTNIRMRYLINAPVQEKCVELTLKYVAGGDEELITRQTFEVRPKVNTIFLEKRDEMCQK